MSAKSKAIAPVKPAQAGDDLAILHPERDIELAGRKLTMREYGFLEGLKLAARAEGVVRALAELAGKPDALDMAGLHVAWAAHADDIVAMIAQAADVDAAFVAGLSDADGQALALTWWSVNAPFFIRRVQLAMQVKAATAALHSAASTPASGAPDGVASIGLADSRSVN